MNRCPLNLLGDGFLLVLYIVILDFQLDTELCLLNKHGLGLRRPTEVNFLNLDR